MGRRDNNKDNNLVAGRPWVLSVGSSISFVFIGVHPVSRQEEGCVRRREKNRYALWTWQIITRTECWERRLSFASACLHHLSKFPRNPALREFHFVYLKGYFIYIFAIYMLSNDLPDEIRTYKYDCEVFSIANYRFVIVESRYERRGIVASSCLKVFHWKFLAGRK